MNAHAHAHAFASPIPSLQPVLIAHGIAQSDLGRAVGLSKAAVCRLVTRGQLPVRRAADVRKRTVDYLKARGVSMAHLRSLVLPTVAQKEVGLDVVEHAEAAPRVPVTEPQEELQMLLKNETLTPLARKHFALARSPFVDDINGRDDVFASQHGRYVRAAMLDAATNHGFLAIIGQSGSGKSTLREDLAERIREEIGRAHV